MENSMIKKIRSIFRAYMIRPLIYKIVTKSAIVLVLCLLWNRLVNVTSMMSLRKDAFFIVGLIWVLFSWFQYLKLDGYTLQYVFKDKQKKKEKKHVQKQMADFVDEEVVSFDELEDEEKVVVNLLSNLATGLIFVIISLV